MQRRNVTEPRKTCLMAVTGVFQLAGGIAAANRLAYWALTDAGYSIDILALNESEAGNAHHGGRYLTFANNKVRFVSTLWASLVRGSYSIVFCDHVNLAAALLPFRYISRSPIAVRLNGIEVFAQDLTFEGRLGLRAATRLTAISDFTRKQVIEQFPDLPVTTVDLSLSPSASNVTETSHTEDGAIGLEAVDGTEHVLQSRCILTVGRMAASERYKGQDVLIQAMTVITTQHPDAQLVLAGRGDDYDYLLQLARSQPANVQCGIFMPGYVSDTLLERLYQHCYLFAMPSRGEGFGLVYLEAMRWSKACVGSKTDAAVTIIVHGETGVTVSDPANVEQVASAIVELMNDPDLVEKMGQNGFNRLTQHYLFEQFSNRFVGWLENGISTPSSKHQP